MSGIPNLVEGALGIKAPAPATVYVPAAPTPPSQDPAAIAQQQQAANNAVAAAETGGRASTILTSPLGVTGPDKDEDIAKKAQLLGQ